ncbi:hypothetical protein M2324_001013 [Rhodovulum sulfidophilum]|nr:hypothetical protein [Rhodovulum sulfidophilum]
MARPASLKLMAAIPIHRVAAPTGRDGEDGAAGR